MADIQDSNYDYVNEAVTLPCPSCGSELRYSAEVKKLTCSYCGYEEEIDQTNDKVVEQNLAAVAEQVRDFIPEKLDKKVMDCGNCGAKFMIEAEQVNANCGFCGSEKINQEAFEHQFIQPVGIIPFYVSRQEAERYFDKWIKQGWFHPGKLKRLASIENLHGIYIPFWTYDAHTESSWRGEAGYYYYETRTVRVNGKMQTQQIRKTRWKSRSGHLTHFFDDILVVASGGLQQDDLERILPYRLEEVVNFDPRLLVGWEAEVYNIEVDKGYHRADTIMDYKIRNMCSAQLGGDTQRNLRIQSSKSGQTFKHLILPVWLASYQFQGKTFHFTINGQTGKIHGKKPISWIKITILVLIFVGILAGIYFLRESGVFQR